MQQKGGQISGGERSVLAKKNKIPRRGEEEEEELDVV